MDGGAKMRERLRRVGLLVALVILAATGLAVSGSMISSAGAASGIVAISSSGTNTCALTSVGGVECWGDNDWGQLGNGNNGAVRNCNPYEVACSAVPVQVAGLTSGVTAISTGDFFACALTSAGGVKCWGSNYYGQLGVGTTAGPETCGGATVAWCSATPVDVSGLTSGVSAISAGNNDTCALTVAGGVECWGMNGSGQLGIGTIGGPEMCGDVNVINGAKACSTTPVEVSGLSSGVIAISTTFDTCALLNTGGVKCWGDNTTGQLGDGTTVNRSTPVDVTGLASGVAAISVGGQGACALTVAGGVKCWGDNSFGELGDGTSTGPQTTCLSGIACSTTPVDVSGLTSGVTSVSFGLGACVLLNAGGVKCWGAGGVDLGDGISTGPDVCPPTDPQGVACSTTPIDVSGLTSGVAAISGHCVLLSIGGVDCWGRNVYGQVGDGTTVDRSSPVGVVGLIIVSNAPTIESVTPSNDSVSVTFAPGPDGGSPVTSFTASCSSTNGGVGGGATGAGSPIAVSGLTAGKTYTCVVTANNASGTSPPSAASNSFVAVQVPTAPTGASASPGNGTATLHWQVPASTGGSAITGYVVTPHLAGVAQQSRTFNDNSYSGNRYRSDEQEDLHLHGRSEKCLRRQSPVGVVKRNHCRYASSADRDASGLGGARRVQGELLTRYEQRRQDDQLHGNLHLDERWRRQNEDGESKSDHGDRTQSREGIPLHREGDQQPWNGSSIEPVTRRARLSRR